MNTLQPYPWSEFPAECWIYLQFMSILHLALFIIGGVVLLASARKRLVSFRKQAGRLALFLSLLLVVGSLFNGVWSCSVWGRFYYSTDYVFDFMPFWPITQITIDASFGNEHGRLLGVTLFELQLVWLLFATGTWGVTIFLYRLIRKLLSHRKLLPTAAAPVS